MAEQLYFSRDSKLYLEFDSQVWEIPVLDGFSFSQATNQSEISLSEMQGSDGLSRRGNRVFTDSLAPAEFSFSSYVRPYTKSSGDEHHAVEEALWAVMAGADQHLIGTTGGGLVTAGLTVGGNLSNALVKTYTIDDTTPGITYSSGGTAGEGWEIDIIVASGGAVGNTTVSVVSAGQGFAAGNVINVPTSVFSSASGQTVAGNITLTVGSGGSDLTATGASFYRGTDADINSSFGPAVMVPSDASTGSTINFGQSNRAVLGTCNLYFVMETSSSNPMVYKLESAAINEASIDFEVDGIATINWSGFAKQVKDFQSSSTAGSSVTVQSGKTISGNSSTGSAFAAGDVVLDNADGLKLGICTASNAAAFATDTGVNATTTFIRNRLTQLLVVGTDSTAFPSGTYNLTLTGGNITISNNISYLVPEELGAVNVPIEHVTGGRTTSGSFTCYLTLDTDSGNNGTSVELFNDMTTTGKGLDKVVNDFDVTFQIGGNVTGTPRLEVKVPKCHIDVPTHSIEDVISLETNFAAYTTDFNVANEVQLTYHGDTSNKL